MKFLRQHVQKTILEDPNGVFPSGKTSDQSYWFVFKEIDVGYGWLDAQILSWLITFMEDSRLFALALHPATIQTGGYCAHRSGKRLVCRWGVTQRSVTITFAGDATCQYLPSTCHPDLVGGNALPILVDTAEPPSWFADNSYTARSLARIDSPRPSEVRARGTSLLCVYYGWFVVINGRGQHQNVTLTVIRKDTEDIL